MNCATPGCGAAAVSGPMGQCSDCNLAAVMASYSRALAKQGEAEMQGLKTPDGLICKINRCGKPAKAADGRLCKSCYARWKYWRKKDPALSADQFIARENGSEDAEPPGDGATAAPPPEPAPTPKAVTPKSDARQVAPVTAAANSFEERLLDRLLARTDWTAIPIAVKRRIGEIVLEA